MRNPLPLPPLNGGLCACIIGLSTSYRFVFLLILAREESLPTPDWQLDSTDGDKPLGPPQLDPVLIYSPTGSTDTLPSTPAGSMDSEVFEGRDRLLSRSPRKGPNVFTVSFKNVYWFRRVDNTMNRTFRKMVSVQKTK